MTQEHKKAIIEFSKMVYPIDKYSGIYNGAGRMDLVNHLEKAFSSPDLLDKLGLQVIPQKSGEIPQDPTKSNWIRNIPHFIALIILFLCASIVFVELLALSYYTFYAKPNTGYCIYKTDKEHRNSKVSVHVEYQEDSAFNIIKDSISPPQNTAIGSQSGQYTTPDFKTYNAPANFNGASDTYIDSCLEVGVHGLIKKVPCK